ncbi:MAG: hypothetical protein Q6363_008275 [Candidatus Njordarchaeota archaeon]
MVSEDKINVLIDESYENLSAALSDMFSDIAHSKPSSIWFYIASFLPFNTFPQVIKNTIFNFMIDAIMGDDLSSVHHVHITFRGTLDDVENFLQTFVHYLSIAYKKINANADLSKNKEILSKITHRNVVLNIEIAKDRNFEASYIISDSYGIVLLPTDFNEHTKTVVAVREKNFCQAVQEYLESKLSTISYIRFPLIISAPDYRICLLSFLNTIISSTDTKKANPELMFKRLDNIIRYLSLIYIIFNRPTIEDLMLITLPPKLYDTLIYIRDNIIKAADAIIHKNYPYHAHHDSEHAVTTMKNMALKVMRCLAPDLDENRYLKINMLERFLALLSALVHDLGLAFNIPSLDLDIFHNEWIKLFEHEFKQLFKRSLVKRFPENIDISNEKITADLILGYIRRALDILDEYSKKAIMKIEGEEPPGYKVLRKMHNVITYLMLNDLFRKLESLDTLFVKYGDGGLLLQSLARIALGHRNIKIPVYEKEIVQNEKESQTKMRELGVINIDSLGYVFDVCKIKVNLKLFFDTLSGVAEIPVRERMLASFLRLADNIDIERRSRANPKYLHFLRIESADPSQIEHWAYKLLIEKTEIEKEDDKTYVVSLTYFIPPMILAKCSRKSLGPDPIDDIYNALLVTEVKRVLEDVDYLAFFYKEKKSKAQNLWLNLKTDAEGRAIIKLNLKLFNNKIQMRRYVSFKDVSKAEEIIEEKLGKRCEEYVREIGSIILECAPEIFSSA